MTESGSNKRKPALLIVAGVFAVAAIAAGVHHYQVGRWQVETDNAYVGGNVVQISPQSAGTVIAIAADDTDWVQAGQVVVRLDPTDAQVSLQQAEADLARTVREVRTLFATTQSLRAQIALKEADSQRAQSELSRAKADYQRRAELKGSGAISAEELANAAATQKSVQAQALSAQSAVVAAKEQLLANLAQTDGTRVATHPSVLRAAAVYRAAYLATQRAGLVTPVSGYVAKRSVQIGAKVTAGTPLMGIVPLDQVWVDANFKEAQLRDLRLGQPVQLHADVYGDDVIYHGKVAGLSAGTGGAFALIPAQNATGNWIKVVQRVPVRIVLNPDELKAHPLRIGLSMTAIIDTHNQQGSQLAAVQRSKPAFETQVYDGLATPAEARIEAIIQANAT